MDIRNIRHMIGFFSCIIVIGLVSTFVTTSIISVKRKELYADSVINDTSGLTVDGKNENTESTAALKGPMSNILTKEKYMKDIGIVEAMIDDMWENITDLKGTNAISAAKYEKRMWEDELERIFKLYLEKRPAGDADRISKDKSAFEAECERKALLAARNANEAIDGLAYNKEYARLLREKTYEYIDRYFDGE